MLWYQNSALKSWIVTDLICAKPQSNPSFHWTTCSTAQTLNIRHDNKRTYCSQQLQARQQHHYTTDDICCASKDTSSLTPPYCQGLLHAIQDFTGSKLWEYHAPSVIFRFIPFKCLTVNCRIVNHLSTGSISNYGQLMVVIREVWFNMFVPKWDHVSVMTINWPHLH